MRGCSVRAIWILNRTSKVVFSRRFPTVEKEWKQACGATEQEEGSDIASLAYLPVPLDAQLVLAFQDRKQREGAVEGSGIRPGDCQEGSDAWVDDVITRHVISLQLSTDAADGKPGILWPIILHTSGTYRIMILPLVEPGDLLAYKNLCWRKDCGNATHVDDKSLSDILLELPCIAGSLELAHVLGEVVTGELTEPEMYTNTSSTMGGLFDTITGGIGLGGRAKPVAMPVASAATAVASAAANATSAMVHGGKGLVKSDRDALRSFVNSAMPFGTPLDLNPINLANIRASGFSAQDVVNPELKQPAWKPYMYRGKARILFSVLEVVTAAVYDQENVEDVISLSGQVVCRADVEGLPEVLVPITCPTSAQPHSISYHPCTQAPEVTTDKHTVAFSPPLGNFVLARYTELPPILKPPLQGFYQLSMVSRDKGAFLMRMRLMEGYKSPLTIDHCSLIIPFPRRRILTVDGTPSYGTSTVSEHAIEWRIVVSGRAHSSKNNDVTFSGTVNFAPEQWGTETPEDTDENQSENYFDGAETGVGGADPVDWEEPFCWDAYNYAKATIRILGGTMSGISIDLKSVTLYPQTSKPTCEFSSQVVSGEYIFWNSLGRYPRAANPKA